MKKANAVIVGNIEVAEEYDRPYNDKVGYDGPINQYKYSLLIQFPDEASCREAIKNKNVLFTVLGD